MTTRPRHYASLLLKDIRPYVVEWFEKNGVPKEYRRMVLQHISNVVAKSLAGRKK